MLLLTAIQHTEHILKSARGLSIWAFVYFQRFEKNPNNDIRSIPWHDTAKDISVKHLCQQSPEHRNYAQGVFKEFDINYIGNNWCWADLWGPSHKCHLALEHCSDSWNYKLPRSARGQQHQGQGLSQRAKPHKANIICNSLSLRQPVPNPKRQRSNPHCIHRQIAEIKNERQWDKENMWMCWQKADVLSVKRKASCPGQQPGGLRITEVVKHLWGHWVQPMTQ